MLLETRRKRRRSGAAFTVADLPRPPRPPPPPTAPSPPPPTAEDHPPEESRLIPTPSTGRTVDRRVLLSRASRLQLLLAERLRRVDLRRARRAELLDEITRLRRLVAELQRDIDATTRSLEQLERLVERLQQISFGEPRGAEPTRLAPGTVLWTNPSVSDQNKEDAPKARAPGGRLGSSTGS